MKNAIAEPAISATIRAITTPDFACETASDDLPAGVVACRVVEVGDRVERLLILVHGRLELLFEHGLGFVGLERVAQRQDLRANLADAPAGRLALLEDLTVLRGRDGALVVRHELRHPRIGGGKFAFDGGLLFRIAGEDVFHARARSGFPLRSSSDR